MSATDDAELTLTAKEAVRGYMLKLVALPAVALALASFAIGFGINELARGAAYNAALEQYSSRFDTYSQKVVDQAIQIGAAQSTVGRLVQDVGDSNARAAASLVEINNKSNDLSKILSGKTAEIATFIATNPEFVKLLGQAASSEVQRLATEIDALKAQTDARFAQLSAAGGTIVGTPTSTEPLNNGGGTLASCPPGSFMSAIQLHKETNGVRTLFVSCGQL